ncbi:MAG: rhomboid family intramembrane serine protease [Solirubrobacterales bacterium]
MAQTCYRHPNRETGVSCSSCGKPICPECMTPTPVGMRCPECARHRTKVVRNPTGTPGQFSAFPVTMALIVINVIVYLIEVTAGSGGLENPSGKIVLHYGLYGPFVNEGEWYRLVTSGFLHANLFPHLFFNMLLLFLLGRLLEPALGSVRFLAIYFASLLAGSFGALILDPNSLSLGASGAIFGIFGAGFVLARRRGLDALASQIGFLIILNLALTLADPGISIGAHLGGLAGGLICIVAVVEGERGRLGPNRLPLELALIGAVAAISVVGALTVA